MRSFFGLPMLFSVLFVAALGLFSTACDPPAPTPDVPSAAFTAAPVTGPAPLVVQFTDTSTTTSGASPETWLWDFGDDTTSTDQSPSHTYEEVGVYSVSLTVTLGEETDSETQTDLIDVRDPDAPPSIPTALVFPLEPITGLTARISGAADPNATIHAIVSTNMTFSTVADGSGAFALDVTLLAGQRNRLSIVAENALGLRSAPAPVEITQDAQAPMVAIDFPEDGAELTNESIQVAGRISDVLSGFHGLEVQVNGAPADVFPGIGTNGSFERQAVPLAVGATVITASGTDIAGNIQTATVTVTRIALSGARLTIISGNDQSAEIKSELPDPVVVKISNGDGSPFANKNVNFQVTRSDGRLATTSGETPGEMMLQARTDAEGLARAYWRLGSDAGRGNNRLAVTSEDIAGTTFFCASAEAGPAAQINVMMGNDQRAETGATAPERLIAWVSDGGNAVAGVPVTFRIISGDGSFPPDGATEITIDTDITGNARTYFNAGEMPGSNIVHANFEGNPGLPASFAIEGVQRTEGQPTTFSGIVLDNASSPVGGVEVGISVNGVFLEPAITDEEGRFLFTGIPDGPARGRFDGRTATTLGGEPITGGGFPRLPFETTIIANAANTLPRAVFLPQLDPANEVQYDGTQDVELRVAGVEGLKMVVKAGSMTNFDGTIPSPANPATLSLTQVHYDDVPMALPGGVATQFAWTLQPSQARFDPPVEITYPNMSGLPAGAAAYFLSFEHGTNAFEIAASGRVSDDASEIVSDPGSGLYVAGWGGNCPPYAVTGVVRNCFEVAVAFLDGNPRCPQAFPGVCPEEWSADDFSDALGPLADGLREIAPYRVTAKIFPAANSAASQLFAVNQWLDRLTEEARENVPGSAECPRPYLILVGHSLGGDTVRLAEELAPDVAIIAEGISRELVLEDFPNVPFYQRDQVLPGLGGIINFVTPDGLTAAERENCSNIGVENFSDIECLRGFRVEGDTVIEVPGTDHRTIIESAAFQDRVRQEVIDALDLPTPPKQGDEPPVLLDSRYTLFANGQAFRVEDDGLFVIPNITAPDLFGTDGPSSVPDFIADDVISIVGVANIDGVTKYATSDSFRVLNNGVAIVNSFTLSDTPPPFPKKLDLDAASSVLQPDATTQLTATAVKFDDTEDDVTPVADGTTYRVSSTDFITVDNEGVLTAIQNGVAVVTASNQGVTSAKRVTIASDTISTTVEGFVRDADGNPVAGVVVTTTAFGGTATTDADGFFTLVLTLPSTTGFVTLIATVGEDELDTGLIPVVPDGITDAGIIAPRTVLFTTTVSGTVEREDGSPVEGAAVFTSLGGQGLTDASGDFSFVLEGNVPSGGLPLLDVTARITSEDITFSGQVTGLTIVTDGVTDAGTITVRETIALLYPGARFPFGGSPQDVATGDINGDDLPDIVVITNDSLNGVTTATLVSILNRGDGTFSDPNTIPVGEIPMNVKLADLNEDSFLDAVFAGFIDDSVFIALGNGDGTFAAPEGYVASVEGTSSVAVGDINGDEIPDVVANSSSGNITTSIDLFLGNGDGTLQTPTTISTSGSFTYEVALADANGDENLDIYALNRSQSKLEMRLGNGDATFQDPVSYDAVFGASNLVLADLNGDDTLDAACTAQDGPLGVLLGNEDGTFEPVATYPITGNARCLTVGDLDGDGTLDLATGNSVLNSGALNVFFNDGEGAFSNSREIGSSRFTRCITNFDADGDSIIDLLPITGSGYGDVVVLRGLGEGDFDTQIVVPTGDFSNRTLNSVDLDGDDHLDLITVRASDGQLLAIPGNGDATFDTPIASPLGTGINDFVTGFVNGDALLDGVSAHGSPGRVGIVLGSEGGTFAAPTFIELGDRVAGVALGDFDRDGAADVAAVPSPTNGITILLGIGDGTFQNPIDISAGSPQAIRVANINGDNNPDLVTAEFSFGARVFLGNGDGSFQAPVSGGEGQFGLAVGDVNGDGNPDIVGSNFSESTIYVSLGRGDGTFENSVDFEIANRPYQNTYSRLLISDVSLDGAPDILFVEEPGIELVGILIGDGTGFFSGQSGYDLTDPFTGGIVVGDFNEDGLPDIAAANGGASNLSVLLHR